MRNIKRYAVEVVFRASGENTYYPMDRGLFWGWNRMRPNSKNGVAKSSFAGALEFIQTSIDNDKQMAGFKVLSSKVVEVTADTQQWSADE